jgi:hypothetical protein
MNDIKIIEVIPSAPFGTVIFIEDGKLCSQPMMGATMSNAQERIIKARKLYPKKK